MGNRGMSSQLWFPTPSPALPDPPVKTFRQIGAIALSLDMEATLPSFPELSGMWDRSIQLPMFPCGTGSVAIFRGEVFVGNRVMSVATMVPNPAPCFAGPSVKIIRQTV